MRSPEQIETAMGSPVKAGDWARREKWALVATGLLVGFLYAPSFRQLVSDWWRDENYSHGFIVPIVFAWLLWQRRAHIAQSTLAPCSWGLVVVTFAALQLAVGTLGAEHFVTESSFLVMLSGITIYLFGQQVFQLVMFPIGWLVFMIPLPAIIFYSITFPLQLMASRWASGLLDVLAVPNLCQGNVIYLPNLSVGVAEACSGIRSLISLLAFSVLIGHFLRLSKLGRWLLALAAVPIALGVNAARIVVAGVVGNYVGPQWAEGFYHTFAGWLLFLGAVVLTFSVAQALRRFSAKGAV